MINILNKLKNLIKTARLLSSDDSGNIRIAIASYLQKNQKTVIHFPYGLSAKPPPNSLMMVFAIQGQEGKLFAIVDDPANRPIKNLKDGEVVLANYKNQSYIYLKDNGDIEIQPSSGTLKINANIDITGIIKGSQVFNGADSNTHIHPQAPDSAGNIQENTGVPQ